jgi:HlyD family secretion protein
VIKDTSAQDRFVNHDEGLLAKKYRVGVAFTAVLLMTLGAFYGFASWRNIEQSISSERLRFGTVERGDLIRDIAAQGKIVAAVSPTVYSPSNGIITLFVKAGDEVIQNQLVAEVESPELTNRLLQERASLSKLSIELERQKISTRKQELKNQQKIDLAKVNLDAADREMRRAESSIDSQAISLLDYEKAQDDLNTANLQHQHAIQDALLEKEGLEFELKIRQFEQDRQNLAVSDLERQVEELQIRSSVSGVIGNLSVEQKENVSDNQPLLTVVDLSEFEVEIKVPESFADNIGLNMGAEITLNGENKPGLVIAVSPEIVNNQVTARLRFHNQNVAGLKQNQRVSARVLLESKRDVLKIKRGPFFESGAGHIAYVVQGDVATRKTITTGSTSISEIEVVNGLNQGDVIIISSHELFNDAATLLIN